MPTEGRHALVIGTWRYRSSQLEPLRSPERDVPAICTVLSASHVGDYRVHEPLENVGHSDACQAVARFLSSRKPRETCLVYISGHGVKNHDGSFYFAMSDTDPTNDATRRTTTLPGEFLVDEMRRCRAGTIVALLDCCYSGAILARFMATKGASRGPGRRRGWAILAAAGGEDAAAQETAGGRLSLWTEGIVHGLDTGRAADGRTGLITVDDLHRYAHAWVQERRPQQHPRKWVVGADAESLLIALGSRAAAAGPQPPPVPQPPEPEPPADLHLPRVLTTEHTDPREPDQPPVESLEPADRVDQLKPTLDKLSRLVAASGATAVRRLRAYLVSELAGYSTLEEREDRYEQAIQDLTTYVDAGPDGTYGAVARRLRGDVWRLLGSYEEALLDLNACLDVRPRDADALRIRGHVLHALGRYDQALRDLEQSLALRPDMFRPEDRMTDRISEDLRRTVDQHRGTLDRLNRILDRDPRNPAALRLRARASRMIGDYDRALDDLDNLPGGVSDPDSLRLRGEIFYARGQYREAIADLRKVVQRQPDDHIAGGYLRSAERASRRPRSAGALAAADQTDHRGR